MKRQLYIPLCAALLAAFATHADAQDLRTAYFSDSYIYRHQMNPALANTAGYIAMPSLGNINLGASMNFGVKNFIFKRPDGTLTTFMNANAVSANDFLDGLKDKSTLAANLDLQLLSVGFKAFKGYNTIDIGTHTRIGLSLPKDLFAFMKEMSSDRDYSFTDLRAGGMVWTDIALGHSHAVGDALRVGAKIKFLVGIGYANAKFDNCSARFGSSVWNMSMRGEAMVAGGGTWTVDDDGLVDGYDDFKAGVNGFGVAVDLGATYDMNELVPGLKLSAAITDIGRIKWDVQNARTDGQPFTFDGFNDIVFHDSDEDPATGCLTLKHQWEGYDDASGRHVNGIKDDLEQMYNLRPDASKTSESAGIGLTATFGAEYEIPTYRKVSFGLLYTERFDDLFGYQEGRLNVNYAPSRAFDLSLSAAVTSYGFTAGAVANLHLPGFNLFIGTDRIYTGSVNSDYIPLEQGGLNLSIGLNFPFGW